MENQYVSFQKVKILSFLSHPSSAHASPIQIWLLPCNFSLAFSPPHAAIGRFCHIYFFPRTSLPLNHEVLGARAGDCHFHPCIVLLSTEPAVSGSADARCMPDEWMTKLNHCSHLSTITPPLPHRLVLGRSWGQVLLLSSQKVSGPVEVLVPWLAQFGGKRKVFPN